MNAKPAQFLALLAWVALVHSVVMADSPSPPSASGINSQSSSFAPGIPTSTTYSTGASPTAPAGEGPPGFWDRSLLTLDWGGTRKTLEADGFTFTPTWFGEVFGNPSGGAGKGVVSDGLFDLPIDMDFDKMSAGAVHGLTFHADAEYIYGPNITSFIHDFSGVSNIAGYNSLRLQELWLQQLLFDQRLSIKLGNIAVDSEFFQSASSALFINSTFGAPTLLANNIPTAPVYPVASPGVRLLAIPAPDFYVMAGVFGMDDGSNPATNNQNGLRFALDGGSGMLVMSEIGYLLNQGPKDEGLQGTYRLGSFVHTENYDNWGSQARNALGTGSLQGAGANYGIYGVMDQQIFNSDDRSISLFIRGGIAPSNVNFVDRYIDGGFNFTGFIPGRKADIAGLAVARSHVSGNYSDSQTLQGNPPFTAETVLEATYKVQLAPWWSLQPDFQYIITPSGEKYSHNALVVGVRSTVAF